VVTPILGTVQRRRSHTCATNLPSAPGHEPGFAAALAVAVVAAFLRLAYLAWWCPFDLATDEAHYWDWSRHLDWSYYSKGPLVAWLIRLSCWVWGQDTVLAIRFPAVACGSLTLLGVYQLTVQTTRRPAWGLAAQGVLLLLPVFTAGSLLMTIDAPYVCLWTWALVVAQRLTRAERPGSWGWAGLGLLLGLGILAKYTMVLFLPGLLLYLLAIPDQRQRLATLGPWLTPAVASLSGLPILMWNWQHDWVTLKHVGGQAGWTEAKVSPWLGPLEFLGGQTALLLGLGFALWLMVLVHQARRFQRRQVERPDDPAFLLACLAAPMFGVFLAFSVKTKVQPNWPIAAYITALPLMVAWVAERWRASEWVWLRRTVLGTLTVAAGSTALIHDTAMLYPMHGWLHPRGSVRTWDPSARLRGWSELAARVEAVRQELRDQGHEPVLAAAVWNVPGTLAFYLPDHPEVYCYGVIAGSRHSQYDLWRPNPVADPATFQGRTFICVGDMPPAVQAGFAHVDPPRIVQHVVHGQVVATWWITVAHGFQGWPTTAAGGSY
jgi:4-amino-4-deoxy-L-arabinose transferase-like glycosyltransferase